MRLTSHQYERVIGWLVVWLVTAVVIAMLWAWQATACKNQVAQPHGAGEAPAGLVVSTAWPSA